MTNTDIEKAQRIIYLLSAAADGKLTDTESEALMQWVEESQANKVVYDKLLDKEAVNAILNNWDTAETEASLSRVTTKISNSKSTVLWKRIAMVAAATAAIVFGIWFYEAASSQKASRNDEVYSNDIAPGKNTATLTLANGKVINLSTAKTGIVINPGSLKYNDGSKVNFSAMPSVQMLTASTPRGGTYQVILPDGTQVWLNADSKISFPSKFSGEERKVILAGEAYFQVAHNKAKPFKIVSSGQEVQVLGTHLNINSYEAEPSVKTTLLEGSVRVSPLKGKEESTILKPGQQSILSPNNPITVKEVNTEDVIAWKNGLFVFDGDRLENIMLQLSRWYNIDVQYADERMLNETFSGTITRFANISIVLKRLEITGNVKFKIDGRRIVVGR